MRHWINKFRCAGRGLLLGVRGQSSFAVHFAVAAAVIVAAIILHCELWQWCTLLLCIAMVLGLEYINSAIEHLAKGLCTSHNEQVGAALDIASAAVLVVSTISVVIGALIFINQFLRVWLGFV
ncbi:MAG: diacylglycerol kinase [Pirellulaceae bacterium]|nr:diacylglycerol kinase [Pirellulaceae bacterium]